MGFEDTLSGPLYNPFGFAGWGANRWGVCSSYFASSGRGKLMSAEMFKGSDIYLCIAQWSLILFYLRHISKSQEPEINRFSKPFKLSAWEFCSLYRICSSSNVCLCMQEDTVFHRVFGNWNKPISCPLRSYHKIFVF